MIHLYEANNIRPLVRYFYEKAWNTVKETREVFEKIGLELTNYAFNNVQLLNGRQREGLAKVYAAPIARAGCGLFRPSVIRLLNKRFQKFGVPFETFGIGLSRSHEPNLPAKVYWNTLRYLKNSDLSSSLVLLYEMGIATGSTIEGLVKELKILKVDPAKILFLVGAACIEQNKYKFETIAPGISLVIGSLWKYEEKPGPTQFYLNQLFDEEWIFLDPRDWGRCVSDMKDKSSVRTFINWVGQTVKISKKDKNSLYEIWSKKIKEKMVSTEKKKKQLS